MASEVPASFDPSIALLDGLPFPFPSLRNIGNLPRLDAYSSHSWAPRFQKNDDKSERKGNGSGTEGFLLVTGVWRPRAPETIFHSDFWEGLIARICGQFVLPDCTQRVPEVCRCSPMQPSRSNFARLSEKSSSSVALIRTHSDCDKSQYSCQPWSLPA